MVVSTQVLVAITCQNFNKKIHTFSIIDSDPRYNEKQIEKIINHLNCKHTFIESDKENFLEKWRK